MVMIMTASESLNITYIPSEDLCIVQCKELHIAIICHTMLLHFGTQSYVQDQMNDINNNNKAKKTTLLL